MLLHIPNVLTPEQVVEARRLLDQADWIDGRATAGFQSVKAKSNEQIPQDHPIARTLGDMILGALERNPTFIAAALPLKVFPPMFNRYRDGGFFGNHVDNAIRPVPGAMERVRTDLSATLFFTGPDEYDGGELLIDDTYGVHSARLPAGDMVLYPSTSLHRVEPVTRGARVCSFFWIQSMIRDDWRRTMMFDLDTAIQRLNQDFAAGTGPGDAGGDHPSLVQLTSLYHNLLRHWADT